MKIPRLYRHLFRNIVRFLEPQFSRDKSPDIEPQAQRSESVNLCEI